MRRTYITNNSSRRPRPSILRTRGSNRNFFQPQTEGGNSGRTGIFTQTQEAKNVWQRLGDKDSSLWWWDLIWPTKVMSVYQWTRSGTSSSCDSKFSISTLSTDSKRVTTGLMGSRYISSGLESVYLYLESLFHLKIASFYGISISFHDIFCLKIVHVTKGDTRCTVTVLP